jgi:TP901 family phage tail tape measure protein
MAATLQVPVTFTGRDKISAVIKTMGSNVASFASGSERMFRKFSPALSELQSQFLSFASTAAIVGGIVSGVHFSTRSIMDYEDALASFRTIVSDLNDNEFSAFKTEISSVAKAANSSTIEVAKSFENIAGLNEKFAKTSEGLGKVSSAAITMAKASRDSLDSSAASLVGIMNQFSLMEDQADRTINVLAAGQAVGAASIVQTSEAMKNFGSVAAGSNISLEQSVGLIQTLGKFSVFGAEAGTKLRGSILKLQKAGVGYSSGQFQINDALEEASKKMSKLRTEKQKDAFLNKMFGAENVSTGRILLANIDTFKEFTEGVTGTSEAQKAAAINSSTLSAKIEELKNKWVTMITTSDSSSTALEKVKSIIGFVTDNLDTLIMVAGGYIGVMTAWWVINKAVTAALFAYNTVLGISAVIQGKSAIALRANTVALTAYKIAAGVVSAATWILTTAQSAATVAQWAFNAAMYANPIGLVVLAIVALIGIIYVIIKKWEDWGSALTLVMGPLGIIISLVQSFRKHWDSIKKAFTDGGMIAGLKRIGAVLIDALLTPIEGLLKLISKIPGVGKIADAGLAGINVIREKLGIENEPENKPDDTPALQSPQVVQQQNTTEIIKNTKGSLDINIKDPSGMVDKTDSSGNVDIPIKLTSTNNRQ